MKQQTIKIGREYPFSCAKCGNALDRKGTVCCTCKVFTDIKNKEESKAELRAVTQLMKVTNPDLIKKFKLQAREMAVKKVSSEYGIKIT